MIGAVIGTRLVPLRIPVSQWHQPPLTGRIVMFCNRTRLWGVSGEGSMAAHVETIGVDVGSSVLLRYCCFEDLSSGG